MLLGSVDVGIANVGFCVYDTDRRSVVHLERFDLRRDVDGATVPFSDKAAVFLVHRALVRRRAWFARCAAVMIEKQMMRRMIIIQYVFEALLGSWTTVLQVDPRAVKRFVGTGCRGSHAKNKRAAIAKAHAVMDAAGRACLASFGAKQDDVADAFLQALYGAARYEALCAQKLAACAPPPKRKRKRRNLSSSV